MGIALAEWRHLDNTSLDRLLPRLAHDQDASKALREEMARRMCTARLRHGDARDLSFLATNSVHFALTSPPYWTLKKYEDHKDQLGDVAGYEAFLTELDKVWRECLRVVVPGGRLVVVVGDVALARRRNRGRHQVFPLHADIQARCARMGWENLSPIFWNKISSARHEASGRTSPFFGKPFQPGAIIKNDVEYILILRKPGNRSPTSEQRLLSLMSAEEHSRWFRQVWTDVPGTSRSDHPAPFPEELARRLIRMFSFHSDTILDPFAGSGTSLVAAAQVGRDSVGVDVTAKYLDIARKRLSKLENVTTAG